MIKTAIKKLVDLKRLVTLHVPPGHFYSPIPNIEELKVKEKEIFDTKDRELAGIDLNEVEQLEILAAFKKYYDEQPFPQKKTEGMKYYFENSYYSYADGMSLYSMMRYLKPKRIIEVGSGYSSSVTLDTNQLFFDNKIELTFIEPYPERLLSLVQKGDEQINFKLFKQEVQNVELKLFKELEQNDILLIDSSHVSKTNSDVNYLLFKVMPVLQSGVIIHFHDIHYPFEYPKHWIYQGWAWNEAYILRAFLQYNKDFKIVFFYSFLKEFYEAQFKEMPLYLKNPGGNIWLRKIVDD
ncbi:MAG: class I SAM-dependent methyltransferase [Gomphosphaeria aponina SAG 52.96 = DSM 107014]|uniref:Class I SAM-dependent methyltransferase n=1 Tax=Gomphosphaeria aponina SAG 52.96 = DSM 107014 TaxID=1521640 RepID=A0A941GPU8_9CHRO|nr:class I SAM-dependent methyltransferase [Gomphosphaeria aponina SAG 52.96 = DSM 107014]